MFRRFSILILFFGLAFAQFETSDTLTGTLGVGSDILSSGEYARVYNWPGDAGEVLFIHLGSSDFDAYLLLDGPNGERLAEVDNPSTITGNDAFLVVRLPQTGQYSITVTTAAPNQSGAYTLYVQSGVTVPTTYHRLLTGNLRLERADGSAIDLPAQGFNLEGTGFSHVYLLEGQAGQTLDVTVTSEIDTQLFIVAPDGTFQNNDDSDGMNPRLQVTLPASGFFPLFVNAFGNSGAYRLTIR